MEKSRKERKKVESSFETRKHACGVETGWIHTQYNSRQSVGLGHSLASRCGGFLPRVCCVHRRS